MATYKILADSLTLLNGHTVLKDCVVDSMYLPEKNIPDLVSAGFIEEVKPEAPKKPKDDGNKV